MRGHKTYRCNENERQKHDHENKAGDERADGTSRRHELGVGERRPVARRQLCLCLLAFALDTREREEASGALD